MEDDDGFNGAAPVKERKTVARGPGSSSASSFNGAAPVKERKTSTPSLGATAAVQLQWGRSGEGAEDMSSRGSRGDGVEASMGPLR